MLPQAWALWGASTVSVGEALSQVMSGTTDSKAEYLSCDEGAFFEGLQQAKVSPEPVGELAHDVARSVHGVGVVARSDLDVGDVVVPCSRAAGSMPMVAWADLSAGDVDDGDSVWDPEADPAGTSGMPAPENLDLVLLDVVPLLGRAGARGLAEARCNAASASFTLPHCAPRLSGPRRRATAV